MHKRGVFDNAGKVLKLAAGVNQTIKTLGYTASVMYTPTTTGSIQYTLDADSDIDSDNATWVSWSLGSVGSLQAAVFPGPISAIRCTAPGILIARIHKCQP